MEWFSAFVEASAGKVGYFTFHEYAIGNGPQLDPNRLDKSFLDAVALDKSGEGAATLAKVLAAHVESADQQLWAGETAAANNGGQAGITDTFIDGFWYLDQLGAHAQRNVRVFQRQELLSHAGYPLINEGASGKMTPVPDYWIALVHKRTMGAGVLGVSSSVETVRAYAHCAAAGAGGASDGSDGETNANSDSDGDGGVTLAKNAQHQHREQHSYARREGLGLT